MLVKEKKLDEKSIAFQLLVELFSHQFAYPVKWTDTQDSLLSGNDAVSRIVELGPSKVLVGMGQKTIKRQMASADRAPDANVQFLASTQDLKDICYEYEAQEPTEEEGGSASEAAPQPAAVAAAPVAAPAPAPAAAAAAAASAGPTVEDAPLSGTEIVRVLVARKLKKAVADVPASKSIKELCGGKSTLQNELVGDLYAEFNTLPDRPEDLPLQDLGAECVVDKEKMLGKTASALVSKFVASKMPSRFNAAAIRSHLAERWGLGSSRQTGVIFFAVAAEPPSRLASSEAAEQYWDQVVSTYSAFSGVALQPCAQAAGGQSSGASQLVDSSVLAEFSKSQKRMAAKQHQALAEYLGSDLPSAAPAGEAEALAADLQRQLDTWTAEFSEDFLAGISPTFSAKKVRRYTSWWNNARQEIMGFFHDVSTESKLETQPEAVLESFINRVCTKADVQLAALAESLMQDESVERSAAFENAFEKIVCAVAAAANESPLARPVLSTTGPQTTVAQDGTIEYAEIPRPGVSGMAAYADFLAHKVHQLRGEKTPAVCVKALRMDGSRPETDLTPSLLQSMSVALTSGVSFEKRVVLVTGAGQGSIGSEVIRLLLAGGACVIATTSREPSSVARYFQEMYEEHGGKDSELHLVQFNQASAQDCERLIDHVYDSAGLDRDLDAIIPFAAAPEGGVEMDAVGARNELVHRLMLVNVFRLLGRIVKNKRDRGIDCHPTQVLLPLSPNHGIFGGDGLYPESKMGLETLLNRSKSESWSEELSVCGVKIGWTRSTGLMTTNDIVAEAVEKNGVLTFSAQEMAFNIAMLLTQEFADLCEDRPIHADFGGRLDAGENFHEVLTAARQEINLVSEIARAVQAEDAHEQGLLREEAAKPTATQQKKKPKQKAFLRVGFPELPTSVPNHPLKCVKDLSNTVAVVGFSELGPWGSARLRWEIESQGRLSREGYIEMAWLMNLIKHFDGPRKDGSGHYAGWVDAKTGEPVDDDEVPAKYGEHIAAHAGIRFIEPDAFPGYTYDPAKREFLQETVIDDDLPPFETSVASAEALQLKHGDKVSVTRIEGTDNCRVQLRRGATIFVPKSVPLPWASVGGQIPTGWNAATYGIPQDVIQQQDPVTLYMLCCVAEAFYSAGITDPMEVFQHMHLSELGNFIGTSMGGLVKTRNLYRDAHLDGEIQVDTLQDTFLNAPAAWVNMLLLGAIGPIKTPVGACATGMESLDNGYESILAGRTKMCLVGGCDDFGEEESYGFAKMKATVNVEAELAKGRLPSEMSRPTAESRGGFVETHGCGVQILCRADLAVEMGLPIYAVIAASTMASDKIGRSLPAPGQGVLAFARESSQIPLYTQPSPPTSAAMLLLRDLPTSSSSDYDSDFLVTPGPGTPPEFITSSPTWSSPFSPVVDPNLSSYSPLRAGLATWGLTIDDLDVASLHGTSTKANDLNEPEIIGKQMTHLGRTEGRPLWAVCQKSVTGHPKAPAASWMFNGMLQVLNTGLIPGNRNADSVDPKLRAQHHLCFPTRSVQTKGPGPKAFLLTSFGFGQKSGQLLGVAPRFLFAALRDAQFQAYRARTLARRRRAERAFARAVMESSVVRLKERTQYDEEDATRLFLDPLARITEDVVTGEYRFK